jgi:molybdopterin synthase catalytic subunit
MFGSAACSSRATVLAGASAYFQHGTRCIEDLAQSFQYGAFVVFAGLGKGQVGGHQLDSQRSVMK